MCPGLSDCINMLGGYRCNCISGYQMNISGLCIGKLANDNYLLFLSCIHFRY